MTLATAAPSYISLDGSFFDFALTGYYSRPWTALTLEDIDEVVGAVGFVPDHVAMNIAHYDAFLRYSGLVHDGQDRSPEVLLISKKDSGVNCYGPRIMANEAGDRLILSSGNASTEVEQKGHEVKVGKLSGKIAYNAVQTVNGEEVSAYAKLKSNDGHMFKVAIAIDRDLCNTEGQLEVSLDAGISLQELCLRKKSGGNFPHHMKELGLGTFLVKEAEFQPVSETNKYENYAITLADGRKFRAAGNCLKMLKQGYFPREGIYFVLDITDIEVKGGKTFITNEFIAQSVAEKNGIWPPQEDAATTAQAPAKAPTKAKTAAPVREFIDSDDIPF